MYLQRGRLFSLLLNFKHFALKNKTLTFQIVMLFCDKNCKSNFGGPNVMNIYHLTAAVGDLHILQCYKFNILQ